MAKERSNNTITYSILIILFVFSFSAISFADPLKNQIIETAELGISMFLNQIPEDQKDQYGFPANFLLEDVSLEMPFQLYEVPPSKLEAYSTGMDVLSLTVETQTWYFPVILENRIRCFLIVDWVDDSWEAVSLGNAFLARSLTDIIQNFQKQHGNTIKLIRSYQAREYLFTIPGKGSFNLTPINIRPINDKEISKRKSVKLKNIDETAKRLKLIIKKQLNNIQQ